MWLMFKGVSVHGQQASKQKHHARMASEESCLIQGDQGAEQRSSVREK